MVIHWYGEGCFRVQTGGLAMLTDPIRAESGLTPPRFKADLTVRTLTAPPPASSFGGEASGETVVTGPGEYEIRGLEVRGWALMADRGSFKTYYRIVVEGLRLLFLGHASVMPEASLFENAGRVDLVFIPVGGPPYLEAVPAAKLIKQLEPKVAVASFFKVPGLTRKAHDPKAFFKEFDQPFSPEEKITVKKTDLPERLKLVALKP